MILSLSLAVLAVQGPLNNPTAQIHRGMAPAWAAATVFAGTPGQLYAKPPGRINSPIGPWVSTPSNPGIADFSLANLPAGHPFASQPTNFPVEKDAFSTGRSRIPRHDVNGAPILTGPFANWMAVAVSVSNGSNGTGSGHIRRTRNNQVDPGAEIIAHYLDPNGALDSNLNDGTFVETRRSDLGFAQTGSEDITSLDYPLGALTYNQSTPSSIFFTGEENVIYFSVSQSWYANGNTANFADDGGPTLVNAHPGDIYQMEFTGGQWQTPVVYISRFDLVAGTDVEPQTLDIDALDLDADGEVILFSATKASGMASQLMMMQRTGSTSPGNPNALSSRPLMANATERLTEKLEILDIADEGDEADALCTFDPEMGTFDDQVATAARPLNWVLSASLAYLWNSGTRVGLSSTRRENVRPSTGLPDDMHVVMTGFGALTAASNEQVIFFVGTDWGFVALTGWIPRSSLGPGDTGEIIVPVPASSGTIDVQIFAVIAAFDDSGALMPDYPRATWPSTTKI